VAVNPVQDFSRGIVAVRVIASFDVGLLRPAAFSRASSIT
jgi:hypothetical protein